MGTARRGFLRSLGLAAAATALSLPAASTGDALSAPGCALSTPGPAQPTAASCAACHRPRGSHHPVDLDYAGSAALGPRSGLRALDDVVRRGVYLADGKLQCLTCHDPRSPYKDHIALPPGTKPMPAVSEREPASYEDGPVRTARITALATPGGTQRLAVTAKPLCLSCHTLD